VPFQVVILGDVIFVALYWPLSIYAIARSALDPRFDYSGFEHGGVGSNTSLCTVLGPFVLLAIASNIAGVIIVWYFVFKLIEGSFDIKVVQVDTLRFKVVALIVLCITALLWFAFSLATASLGSFHGLYCFVNFNLEQAIVRESA
jgi:hypothetical protein